MIIDPYSPQSQMNIYESTPNEVSIKVNDDKNGYKASKIEFNEEPKYQDVWASILYLVVVVITLVIGGISIPNMKLDMDKGGDNKNRKRGNDNDLSVSDILIMLGCSIVCSGLLTFGYLILMQKFAGKMIIGTFIISIVLNIIYALITFFINPIMGGVMLLFAVIYGLCYFFWRSRIPFAKIMLSTVATVTKKFPATIVFSICGCFVAAVWYTVIGIIMVAALSYLGEKLEGAAYAVYVFLLFSFYFSTQVVNNTVHVTISGLFATYYFCGVVEPGTSHIEINVRNPTMKSFKRAITTSFGSICFGSLIIAVIQTLKALARQARREGSDEGNLLVVILACCAECILQCIGDIIEYFNVYAFTEVAIYGKSYCQAAKDTWTICKSHGIEALINDNLIGNVLSIGSLTIGCLSTVITCALGFLILGVKNVGILVLFGIIAFLIGCMIFSVIAQVINSGVATTFVCICEDPDALRHTKPELWEKVRDTYPSVVL